MNANKKWDVEAVYTKKSDTFIKEELVGSSKLSELDLNLRLKRTAAYYKFMNSAARTKNVGRILMALTPVLTVVLFYTLLELSITQNVNANGWVLAGIAAVVGSLISLITKSLYRRNCQSTIKNNLNTVIQQNTETLKAFFAEFMQERTRLDALGFQVGDDITIQSFVGEPLFKVYPSNDYLISLIGLIESDAKTSELEVTLVFDENRTTLKVYDYTVKKMVG